MLVGSTEKGHEKKKGKRKRGSSHIRFYNANFLKVKMRAKKENGMIQLDPFLLELFWTLLR